MSSWYFCRETTSASSVLVGRILFQRRILFYLFSVAPFSPTQSFWQVGRMAGTELAGRVLLIIWAFPLSPLDEKTFLLLDDFQTFTSRSSLSSFIWSFTCPFGLFRLSFHRLSDGIGKKQPAKGCWKNHTGFIWTLSLASTIESQKQLGRWVLFRSNFIRIFVAFQLWTGYDLPQNNENNTNRHHSLNKGVPKERKAQSTIISGFCGTRHQR